MKSYEVQWRRPEREIPDARRREAMKTATRLEQWGAIRFRPLRAAMDWYGCTFEWIVGHPENGLDQCCRDRPRYGSISVARRVLVPAHPHPQSVRFPADWHRTAQLPDGVIRPGAGCLR